MRVCAFCVDTCAHARNAARAHEQFIVVYIHAVTINTRMTSIVIASVVASVYLHQSKSSLIFVLLYSIHIASYNTIASDFKFVTIKLCR